MSKLTKPVPFFVKYVSALVLMALSFSISAQEHPNLILTKKGVADIKAQLGNIPIFDATLEKVKKEVDAEMATGIHVPIPKDMAGGYTHDRHKKNWFTLQKAGVLYQILDDKTYAEYVHNVLKEYAKLYPTLPLHPQERSYSRGKLFWQCLNDSNWLVYVSQAYDCIYDTLTVDERKNLEENLFIPYANFLSVETPQFFNRVHNHSTWGNAAVGMIGLVMNNEELINRALYGLKTDNIDPDAVDNDGGTIKSKDGKAGFFANLDEPFSPDGYYTEGPYYQRYAMYPFMIFAEALQNVKPELNILEYKDGILIKAVYALVNLTNDAGEFFPLNDGQKGMSYHNGGLISAIDIAYHFGGKDASLLSIAKKQNEVMLDDTGFSIALGLKEGLEKPFEKKSIKLTDGSDGSQGAVAILRSSDQKLGLVMKNTAHGLSHGHFDKMSFSYHNGSNEILQDYGLARFVNVEQKNGGGYLKENKTWAKQTIAHNTLVQDEISHFKGKFKVGNEHHSVMYLFDSENTDLQISSAKEDNAYPGTKLHRTMLMLENSEFENPILIDVLKVDSDSAHQYDLPFYYHDQIIDANFEYTTPETLVTLGNGNGYQHLWLEGKGVMTNDKTVQTTWRSNYVFYTLSSALDAKDELLFARIGANDPEFNLRKDPAFIVRKPNTQNDVFVSVIETHGSYDVVAESANNAYSSIKSVNKLATADANYTAWSITTLKGSVHTFILSTNNADLNKKHKIVVNGEAFKWKGAYTHSVSK